MHRLLIRAQFRAVLAGRSIVRTTHFAMHRCVLPPVISLTSGMQTDTTSPTRGSVAVSGTLQSRPLFSARAVWLGALVPKRWARQAVTRNLIRRQIYQVGESCESELSMAAHVIRLRARFDRQQFKSAASAPLKAAVRAELQQLFTRAREAGGANVQRPFATEAMQAASLHARTAC